MGQKKAAALADPLKGLVLREEGQEYALVMRMLGTGRCKAECGGGIVRICTIRGSMRSACSKLPSVCVGCLLLVGLRDFQDGKADTIHRYRKDEARRLMECGHLPASIALGLHDAGISTDKNAADEVDPYDGLPDYDDDNEEEEE